MFSRGSNPDQWIRYMTVCAVCVSDVHMPLTCNCSLKYNAIGSEGMLALRETQGFNQFLWSLK